jgi:hypothetical protein
MTSTAGSQLGSFSWDTIQSFHNYKGWAIMNETHIWTSLSPECPNKKQNFTPPQQELRDDLLQCHDYIIEDLGDRLLQEFLDNKQKHKATKRLKRILKGTIATQSSQDSYQSNSDEEPSPLLVDTYLQNEEFPVVFNSNDLLNIDILTQDNMVQETDVTPSSNINSHSTRDVVNDNVSATITGLRSSEVNQDTPFTCDSDSCIPPHPDPRVVVHDNGATHK